MKVGRIAAVVLAALATAGAASVSCTRDTGGVTQQLVEVVRGDLTVTVSGSGKIEAVSSRRLAFSTPGQVAQVYVAEGATVTRGDRIASLNTDALELAVAQAEVAHTQALASVTQGDAALKASELRLNQALNRITVAEVEAAQADRDSARAYLQYVNSNISQAPPDQQASWANALVFAQARLAAAEAKLNAMLTNSDTDEVAVLRRQVDAARESSDLSRRAVTLAEQTLEHARRQLTETTLIAPFGGVVARVNVKEGDSVSPAVIVAEIMDPSAMQLEVQVDEIDVVDVSLGQKAVIELDALPGLTIEGEVTSISLLPDLLSGVVVYGTRISFERPANAAIRVGMSAAADVVVSERKAVLLIPERAIGQDGGRSVVKVKTGSGDEQREIVTGTSNGIQTEVLEGLSEGETVIIERTAQQGPGLF